MIVADSVPIIAFARIGRMDIMKQVVEEVVIPQAVYEELVISGGGRPGASEVEQSDWIHRRVVSDRRVLASFPAGLQRGQREAIALAQELGAQLLIDESRGRREALRRGLDVRGSLRVLGEAKRQGLIEQVRPLVEAMIASGYRMGENIISSFLQGLGE
jgi:predicted nucleic acid-binding protein